MIDKYNTLRAYTTGKRLIRTVDDLLDRYHTAHAYLQGLSFCNYLPHSDYNLVVTALYHYCRQL